MQFQTLTKQDFIPCLALTLALAFLLMMGFIPTSKSFYGLLKPYFPVAKTQWMLLKEMSFFPVLAAFFALTLTKQKQEIASVRRGHLLRISILPFLIAFIFGQFRNTPYNWKTPNGFVNLVWYVCFIPLGEEFLFRGWFYGVIERLWPERMLTATNPLPTALWMSSLGFSLWHLQNLSSSSTSSVIFQVLYTFPTGLWLGYLRWKSAKIYPCILAHFSINLVSGLSF